MEELSKDYKIPEVVEEKITESLLKAFRDALDERYKLLEDDEPPTYLTTYIYLPGTQGWDDSFREACEAEGKEEVYEHYSELAWYNKESFDDMLGIQMVEKGVIEEGRDESIQSIW